MEYIKETLIFVLGFLVAVNIYILGVNVNTLQYLKGQNIETVTCQCVCPYYDDGGLNYIEAPLF